MSDIGTYRCASCGSLNRVPNNANKTPVCGRCKRRLDLAGAPQPTDGDGLARAVAAGVPVLVDFWAPWCGPCRVMAPVLDRVARAHSGQLIALKVDSDQAPRAAAAHGVRGIPTLILFRDKRELARQVGAVPRERLVAWLEHNMASASGASARA